MSSFMADVDHCGTPLANPLTSPLLSNPRDMNYHTPSRVLTRQSGYELWTHMRYMPA